MLAAFVGGSVAAGTADEYSDLDLYLVVADEEYESFFADRQGFISRLGEPVYLEDFDGFGFDMVIFILAGGVKGELGLGRASGFSHIHGGPYRVLVDKIGILDGVSFPLFQATPEEQRAKLAKEVSSFWRYLNLFAAAVGRGRLVTAATYFSQVRGSLLQACYLAADPEGVGGPAERLLPSEVLEAYAGTFFPLEREAMLVAARRAADLLKQVVVPLMCSEGVPYPEKLEKVVLGQLGEVGSKPG